MIIRLLSLLLVGVAASQDVQDDKTLKELPEVCMNTLTGGDGKCLGGVALTQAQDEVALGLDALPARIAVISGQVDTPAVCGLWCETVTTADPRTPCKIDKELIPCETDFYCTTTCALWILMTNKVQRPTISCGMFIRFDGFPITAEPCNKACLLPEIRKERYPAPTGLGLLCEPGTCFPAIASSLSQDVPAILECPCNWFGSDCPDNWVSIETINHTAVYGDIMATTLTVASDEWEKVVANHQPGGVIRVVHRGLDGRTREQPYALAYAPSVGGLEILTAPPDMNLLEMPRAVAERVRSLPSGPVRGGNLFVNPSIGGFFNKEWTFLMDAIRDSNGAINHLVVVSTGAGLSGSLSAVEAALSLGTSMKDIHLFHGLQRIQDLPYKERINALASSSALDVALIESRSSVDDSDKTKEGEGIVAAVRRGLAVRDLSPVTSLIPFLPSGQKVYAQHAIGLDLTSHGGLLQEKGAVLDNTVFVVCGRMALLEELFSILKELLCIESDQECHDILGQRYFTNI